MLKDPFRALLFRLHEQGEFLVQRNNGLHVIPKFQGQPPGRWSAPQDRQPHIGGTDEAVIAGETGLLVPPANPTVLAAAIRAVLTDRPLAQRLAAAGRARVEREFSAAKMVQQVISVYDELLAKREVAHGRR